MTDASPAAPHSAAELRRGAAAVRTAIAPGAPIESLQLDAHEWCAAGPWYEHAPTIMASVLPTYVAGVPGASLPVGGVMGSLAPEMTVRASGGAESLTATWPAGAYPLAVQRTMQWADDGALRLAYEATTDGTYPVPFVWGLTIPLPWSTGVRLELPSGVRARVAASWGDGRPAAGSEFVWPSLRDGGRLLDLSHPTSMPRGTGVLCFVELPRAQFTVRCGEAALEVCGTPGVVTHARVLIEHDAPLEGRTPARWWQRRAVQRQIVIAPTVGAPDTLHEAVGGWKAARWLDARATLPWDLTLRGIPLTDSE